MEKSRKIVLTGGPSCGKSTSIENLRQRGFSVLEEIAREMIEKRGGFPEGEKEIEYFQGTLFNEQLKRESKLNGEIIFLDRGLGDSPAYTQHLLGYIPEKMANYDLAGRYDQIFILDRLPFVDDGLRMESGDEEAQRIHDLIIQSYRDAGYNLTTVPIMGVEERTKFILSKVDLI